jgi:hypothetical protein
MSNIFSFFIIEVKFYLTGSCLFEGYYYLFYSFVGLRSFLGDWVHYWLRRKKSCC